MSSRPTFKVRKLPPPHESVTSYASSSRGRAFLASGTAPHLLSCALVLVLDSISRCLALSFLSSPLVPSLPPLPRKAFGRTSPTLLSSVPELLPDLSLRFLFAQSRLSRPEWRGLQYEAASGVHYPNIVRAITIISRTEGFKGLYSGFLPTIIRDAPYSGLYLLFYSSTRRTLTEWRSLDASSQLHLNFLAGAIAGATATVLTHPPDVIRTKLQLQNSGHMNIFSAARSIFKMHGIRGFFAGVLPRAGRRAVHQAFSWTIYEELIHMLTQVTR